MTPKRRAASARPPARKSTSRGAHQAPRRRAAVAPEPSIFQRHAVDLWAIGLITLGVLLALALWGSGLGPIGHHVNTGFAYLVGWMRVIIPLVCIGAAIVLLAVVIAWLVSGFFGIQQEIAAVSRSMK